MDLRSGLLEYASFALSSRIDTSKVRRIRTQEKCESYWFLFVPELAGREFPRRNEKDRLGGFGPERELRESLECQRDHTNSAATATTRASPPPRRIDGVWRSVKPPTTTTRITNSTSRSAMKFLSV